MDYETTYIGNRITWGGEKPFGILPADRRQHLYIIGQTGTGKSTLLRNLICQDILRGHGVGLIDPHGDLAEDILTCVPSSRTDDVLYFNPSDTDFPIGFNLVRPSSKSRRHLETSGIVGAFKHIWRESWGPRLEYILYATIAALMECENVSLLGLPRMLSDVRYRTWVLKQVKDPIVRSFWRDEYERFDKRFLAEAIAPIQNKIGQLLMAAPLRNVFGQVKNRIDPRFIMDKGRIFIANLSKGRLGEDKTNLLGSLLVNRFQTVAMERADTPEAERRDFYFYIDEFPNFSTDSFASILSEARKYRLNLILAHQHLEQMEPQIRNAVFGNVGSLVSFRVGVRDARFLVAEFGSDHSTTQFTDLSNYELRAKLISNGRYSEPFFGKSAAPLRPQLKKASRLIDRSRERFSTGKNQIESRIERWLDY